jgi:hypothetical protein
MNGRDLKLRLEQIADEAEVYITTPEGDTMPIGEILFFEKEKEVWICIDDNGDMDEQDLTERKGDMCSLPECKGDDTDVPDPVDICEVRSRGAQVA